MTVRELIAALEKMDPDARVMPVVMAENEYDGQPTEMEEWLDYDPDC